MAECLKPFPMKYAAAEDAATTMMVPCGKCPNCLKRRESGWSYRLCVQDKYSDSSHFITLTYNNDNTVLTKNKFLTLRKSDVQCFFKRLRKAELKAGNKNKISYYLAGEYGSKTLRPHYHALVFNCSPDRIEAAWCRNGNPIGNVHIGKVTPASIGYTLKYMCKPTRIPLFKADDRIPEFSLMSKGIGVQYLTPQMINFHLAIVDERMYCPLPSGKRAPMPRYYRDKIYTPENKLLIQARMLLLAAERADMWTKAYGLRAAKMKENHISLQFKKFARKNEIL